MNVDEIISCVHDAMDGFCSQLWDEPKSYHVVWKEYEVELRELLTAELSEGK